MIVAAFMSATVSTRHEKLLKVLIVIIKRIVAMEYGGYAEKTRLEVKYHDTQYSKVPEVKLRRDGDKLVVNVKSQIDEFR